MSSVHGRFSDLTKVVEQLKTSAENGLDSADAAKRLEENGPNQFDMSGGKTWYRILFTNVFNLMNMVLLVAMALSFVVVSWIDAGIIIFVIIFNAGLGFQQVEISEDFHLYTQRVQEWGSEKAMASLRNMSTPQCKVIRGGVEEDIETTALVAGDLVLLESGMTVPADLRLVEVNDLETDEALLTGESEPIKKKIDALDGGDDVSECHDMTYVVKTSDFVRFRWETERIWCT